MINGLDAITVHDSGQWLSGPPSGTIALWQTISKLNNPMFSC